MTAPIRPGALALATLLLSAGAAFAQGDGTAMKSILGEMGIVPKEKEAIHYRERAPLVLPPRMDLREPTASATANNPQWPKDPEVVARRKREAEERVPAGQTETFRMADRNTKLTPDELRADRRPVTVQDDGVRSPMSEFSRLSPLELLSGKKSEPEDDKPVVRRTLTEPPTALRQSATGGRIVAQRAAPVEDKVQDSNAFEWIRKRFHRSSDDDE